MKAEVLTIGDELLRGEIVDSNKSFLSEKLLGIEVETRFHASVNDDPADMRDAFLRAADRSEIVLVSGGLGPTRDDLTVEVLAQTFGRALVQHEPSLRRIEEFFARNQRAMSPSNAKQALVPEGCEVLPNPVGTAPGCMLDVGRAVFFCMPGVPRELYRMMEEQVLPRVAARLGGSRGVMRAALLRTFGLGESNLEDTLADVGREEGVILGFRTAFPDNFLRPVARAKTAPEADAKLARASAAIEAKLGPLVYTRGDETMESVVGRMLAERGLTLATAESCTGGLIGARLTAVAGSSRYYRGGVVAYANEAKRDLLGVSEALLREHGAVSAPVARAMAEGARARLGADLALATTGISGPDGGTPEKPVGLVWIALASKDGTEAEQMIFPFDRERHRVITAQTALDWVRRSLLGLPRLVPRYVRGATR
ncbi:MAG: competence/damage-inducible protein A [Deltaproteobacteria bacterium]|nr:competence/damage-inducible protein A [Deltaproteobacteria bacterium]